MPVLKLRAAMTAILLGTAGLGTALIASSPAMALTVSAKVGPLLNQAKALMTSGKYDAALAKLQQAEAVKSTADDTTAINSMKQYIGVKTGNVALGGAAAARAKFANDYNAGKFKEVIADGELLRKTNALDSQSQLIIAQAYYKAGDYAGCVRYTRAISNSDIALELQVRCAYETGDDATQRQALESLVSRTGKPEYWMDLLKLGERSRGISEHNSLDIYRLRLLTGSMQTKDDYISLGQFALQFGFAAEAQAALEKGVAAKLLTDQRSLRLLATAKQEAAADLAKDPKALAAAKASPQGDALITVGENMIGEGNAKEAIEVIQNGLKKPLKDPANGQIRLGQAYLASGQNALAEAAFNKVKAPAKDAMIAHLWALAATPHH